MQVSKGSGSASSSNKLTSLIMVGLIAGIVVGYICNTQASPEAAKIIAGYFSVITDIFLRMIKMIIAPLVFATIVSGIASLGASGGAVGRITLKAMGWFITASLISLSLGLLFANVLAPGRGLGLPLPSATAATNLQTGALNVKDFVTHIFPTSIVQAMSNNEVLQILIFSIFFGFALSALSKDLATTIAKAVDELVHLMLRITDFVMRFAPIGVFAAIAAVIAVQGIGVLVTYGKFIGTFYLALAVLWLVLIAAGFAVLGPRVFHLLKLLREPMLLAFSTASSEAAFPKTLEQLLKFGVRERVSGFVLPLGHPTAFLADDRTRQERPSAQRPGARRQGHGRHGHCRPGGPVAGEPCPRGPRQPPRRHAIRVPYPAGEQAAARHGESPGVRLGLLNCGGTITEHYQPDGTLDRIGARELTELAGSDVAWVVHDVALVDSSELTFASICMARAAMRRDRESDAFILCCGTDAMEDVAYAAALLLDRDRPVVLTGAALPGGAPGSDAAANLRAAVLLARALPGGAAPLVAFGGLAFDPVGIAKLCPQAVQPFGPVTAIRGTVEAGLVTFSGSAESVGSYTDLDAADLEARVAIVTETFGPIAGFPDVGVLDGLVLAGMGAGGFAAVTAANLRRATSRTPVVLSTRCPQGFRVNPAVAKHAFAHAHRLGLITAGYEGLSAAKARIRLIAELGREQVAF